MNLETLQSLAIQHGAIGFDYDTSKNGKIDWYQLHYAWQNTSPQKRVEPITFEPVHQIIPTPHEAPIPTSEQLPFQNIPGTLRKENRWCVWKRHKDGRKIPYQVLENSRWSMSKRCRSDIPTMWVSFDESLHCFLKADGHLGGLSFALGDNWCGFDFDNVIVNGKMHPQAKSWITRLGGYSEVSQSHSGQKTILQGTLDADFLGTAETGRQFKGIPADGMATEVYHCRRFFFLTGNGSGDPTPNQPAIDTICRELTAHKTCKTPVKPKQKLRQQTTSAVRLSDTAILEKIRSSRQAEKFNQLWNGHIDAYDSQSEADMALTTILMWWCNNDTTQVECLFEQSGLAKREKWDREDYRQRTLAKAVRSNGYTPRNRSQRQSTALQRLAEHRARRQQGVTV